MRVLGLIGSPRRRGNTDVLADTLLAEARANGHVTEKVYLSDLEIGPCMDCRTCKKDPFECILDDDMQRVYSQLMVADVIVFGTPIYWFGPTGPMKTLLDRLRPAYSSHRLQGKKAILIAPAGDGPKDADLTMEMFRRSFCALEVQWEGHILGTGYDRGDILNDAQAVIAATTLGKAL